jgi:DNA-binding NarL/FixJ family response regulator
MVMPLMSGRATYLALRELDAGVKVVLMSGYTMNDEIQAILDLGVKSFVTKPVTVDTLIGTLAGL